MNTLRPVGAEFWHEWPHPFTSTSSYKQRTLYRVVKHLDAVGGVRECVTPLRHQRTECVGVDEDGERFYGEWEDER